ncbi:MAG TPA: hypothetical protein VM425_00935 [Myxococcota bacterium]|nr:hypothetical protein [Myxococcota bacterium]
MIRCLVILLPVLLCAGCGSTGAHSALPAPAGVDVDRALCLATGLPGGADQNSQARRSRRLELARGAGVGLLRWEFLWSAVERVRGDFNFEAYDRLVDASAAVETGWIGLLAYGNPWASAATESDDKYPPDDPADFASYAGATAAHFKDRITRWEIWNEQNAGYRFWLPAADPAGYADLLAAAAAAIRQADPEARVAFGGTFFAPQGIPGALEFIEDCYAQRPDLGDYFDAMAVHPYMLYPPAVAPESKQALPPFDYLEQRSLPEMIADIRAALDAHADGDKPIWITELGWPEFESVPAGQQADYLARAYLLSLAAGVEYVCWFTLEDSVGHTAVWEDSFGLVPYDPDPTDGQDPEPKPAYRALETLSKVLSGTRFDSDLGAEGNLPPDVHLLRFATPDRGRQVLAVWSRGADQTIDLEPSLPGYRFSGAFAMTGEALALDAEDGTSIDAGGDVIYLVEVAD